MKDFLRLRMKITLPRDRQGFKQRKILVQDERMLFRKWHKTDTLAEMMDLTLLIICIALNRLN